MHFVQSVRFSWTLQLGISGTVLSWKYTGMPYVLRLFELLGTGPPPSSGSRSRMPFHVAMLHGGLCSAVVVVVRESLVREANKDIFVSRGDRGMYTADIMLLCLSSSKQTWLPVLLWNQDMAYQHPYQYTQKGIKCQYPYQSAINLNINCRVQQ